MSDSLGSRGAVGSCFGYAVRAPFPLMALRSGEGDPPRGDRRRQPAEGRRGATVELGGRRQVPRAPLSAVESSTCYGSKATIGSGSTPTRHPSPASAASAALAARPGSSVSQQRSVSWPAATLPSMPQLWRSTAPPCSSRLQGGMGRPRWRRPSRARDTGCSLRTQRAIDPPSDPSVLPGLAMLRIRPRCARTSESSRDPPWRPLIPTASSWSSTSRAAATAHRFRSAGWSSSECGTRTRSCSSGSHRIA